MDKSGLGVGGWAAILIISHSLNARDMQEEGPDGGTLGQMIRVGETTCKDHASVAPFSGYHD